MPFQISKIRSGVRSRRNHLSCCPFSTPCPRAPPRAGAQRALGTRQRGINATPCRVRRQAFNAPRDDLDVLAMFTRRSVHRMPTVRCPPRVPARPRRHYWARGLPARQDPRQPASIASADIEMVVAAAAQVVRARYRTKTRMIGNSLFTKDSAGRLARPWEFRSNPCRKETLLGATQAQEVENW
jgi:hypothetical protein